MTFFGETGKQLDKLLLRDIIRQAAAKENEVHSYLISEYDETYLDEYIRNIIYSDSNDSFALLRDRQTGLSEKKCRNAGGSAGKAIYQYVKTGLDNRCVKSG